MAYHRTTPPSTSFVGVYTTPEEYGALGDGVQDDTTFIQTAITNNAGRPIVLNPDVGYKVTSTLQIGYGTTIFGAGRRMGKLYPYMDADLFYCYNNGDLVGRNITIKDLRVVNRAATNLVGVGIHVASSGTQNTRVHISNVQTDGMYQGFNIEDSTLSTLLNCCAYNCGGDGFVITGNNNSFYGCLAESCAGHGFNIAGWLTNFNDCAADTITGDGFRFGTYVSGGTYYGCDYSTMIGCDSENVTGDAVSLECTSYFTGVSISTHAVTGHIFRLEGCSRTTLIGCHGAGAGYAVYNIPHVASGYAANNVLLMSCYFDNATLYYDESDITCINCDANTPGLEMQGNGRIVAHDTGTAVWNPDSVNSGAMTSTTVTVTGAAIGDTVTVGFSEAVPAGALLVGAVTAVNTVTVTLFNITGAPLNLGSGTLRADVWKH